MSYGNNNALSKCHLQLKGSYNLNLNQISNLSNLNPRTGDHLNFKNTLLSYSRRGEKTRIGERKRRGNKITVSLY